MFKNFFGGMMVLPFLLGMSYAKDASGEVVFKVSIEAPAESKDVRLWIPYPKTDGEQTIDDIKIEGNFSSSKVYPQKAEGDFALYAEWTKPAKERFLTFTFRAKSMERLKLVPESFKQGKDFKSQESDIPAEVKEYLKGSPFTPTDGKVKEIASSITNGKNSIIEKAKAVYDWTVENTFRDPNIKGCGTGDVERILSEKGGKCADISGVFVAVVRAAGVPAREVYGLRLGKKSEEDITGGHHCWVEFYLPNYGWVPADPADVRKAMLIENLNLEQAKKYSDYYFGTVDEYRIALTRGSKGYYLNPPQKGGQIPYGFMYPYAEVDGKPLEWLAAQKELKYQITFRKQ